VPAMLGWGVDTPDPGHRSHRRCVGGHRHGASVLPDPDQPFAKSAADRVVGDDRCTGVAHESLYPGQHEVSVGVGCAAGLSRNVGRWVEGSERLQPLPFHRCRGDTQRFRPAPGEPSDCIGGSEHTGKIGPRTGDPVDDGVDRHWWYVGDRSVKYQR
jgi:hypothetical protein